MNKGNEIKQLVSKHDLVVQRVDVSNYPKIIGIGHRNGDVEVCALWRMSIHNSKKRIKKEMKKFLRNYDKGRVH